MVLKPATGKANINTTKSQTAGKGKKFALSTRLSFLLAVISFLIYANTLQNGYVLDDAAAITKNNLVTSGISAIPEILSTPYHLGYSTNPDNLYRPLSLAMFATEYQIFGSAPAEGHFINIVAFVICVVLLFLFLDQLFDKKRTIIVFIAALLFAIHPIHTEVVANIKSRVELLCFLFGFLSLLGFVKYAETGKRHLILSATLYYFLSLLSKETSITFLALIPLIFFFYKNDHKQRSLFITSASVVSALVYLIIRSYVLKANYAGPMHTEFIENILVNPPSASSRLATEILIMGKYLKLLFLPYPLLCDYAFSSIAFASFTDFGVWASLAIYLFLMFFGIFRLIKHKKDLLAFGILLYLR